MGKRHVVVAVGLSLLGAALLFGAPVVSVPGLVGYWRLDETASPAVDDSGSGNNGTWTGAAAGSGTVPPVGPPGIGFTNPRGITLNGVDQYVTIGNPAALNMTAEISVACWINPVDVTGEKKVLAKWADSPAGAFSWLLSVSGDTIFFGVQTATMVIAVSPAAAISAGVWQHVVGTYDGANIRVYVNGAQVVVSALTGAIATTAIPVRIGAGSGTDVTQEEPFNGSIDDVRIYSYDLTATEVTALHNGALPTAPVLTASNQTNAVGLSWTASTGATSYLVQRGPALAGPFATIQTQAGLTFTDTTGTVGTTYYYQIVALNVVGSTTSAPPQPGTPQLPPPRTDDHQEGLIGENCSCGSTASTAPPFWALAVLALALTLRRRAR